MKKYSQILSAFVLLLVATGCFDEYEGTVDISQPWVHFENSAVRYVEDGGGPVTTTLILSSAPQEEDIIVPFSVTSEDGLIAGEDYIINASSFVIPAGEFTVEVILLDSVINNDEAFGDRSLTITMEDTDVVLAGFPGPDKNKSAIEVTLAEDDFTIFGFSNFEEVPSPPDAWRYTRAGTYEMLNNDGEPPVNFVATGSELGFDTSYAEDDLDPGETSAENLGVLNNTSVAASGDPDFEFTTFSRGVQGFASADLDGRIEITFDDMEIPAEVVTVEAEMTFYLNRNTTFETEDALEFYYVTEDGRGEPLMSFRGDDDEQIIRDLDGNAGLQGEWITRIVTLPESQWKNGHILVTMRNGADTEMMVVDYVAIKGIL